MNISLKFKLSDNLNQLIEVSKPVSNFTSTGKLSSIQVSMKIKELGLEKVCKSKNPIILTSKIQNTIDVWETKVTKHIETKKLEKTEKTAQRQNDELKRKHDILANILNHTLKVHDAIDWDSLRSKKSFSIKPSELSNEDLNFVKFTAAGEPECYDKNEIPPQPKYEDIAKTKGFFGRLLFKGTIQKELEKRHSEWIHLCEELKQSDEERQNLFKDLIKTFQIKFEEFKLEKKKANDAVDIAYEKWKSKDPEGIEEYCEMVLENSEYPDYFTQEWELFFIKDTSTIVVNFKLPDPEQLPMIDSYKFIKSKNAIEEKPLAKTKQKELYEDVGYQIAIRTIHELFEADTINAINCIAFNGYVVALNKGTGNIEKKVILSALIQKKSFEEINLENVIAKSTFEHLGGVAGKSLHDLIEVTPIEALQIHRKAS